MQKKAALAIVQNSLIDNPIPRGEVLASIGYSQGITETPSIVTNSDGFKEALVETGLLDALKAQGINPAKIAKKIDYLLNADDYNAVDKGLKHTMAIYGVIEEKPKGITNTYNFLFSEETQAQIKAIDNIIKQSLIHNEPTQTN